MSTQIIFGTSVALSFVAWSIVMAQYVWPMLHGRRAWTHCAPF